MEKKFLDYIKKNKLFKKGDRVIVACSGGADSVALLVMLKSVQQELGISLLVVHVNHNIRGMEAKRDEDYVKFLANQLGVDCVVKSVDAIADAKANKKTLEQSARELRYNALREVKEECDANKIAVAHNLGDQSESVLMHLFRGSGIAGVAGMRAKNGDIVRPLLEFSKNELICYLNAKEIEFKEDNTNLDINYSRNFIRHKIISEVEKVYPSVSCNISKFAKKMQEVEDYFDDILPKHFINKKGSDVVVLNGAEKEHDVILSRLIFVALETINSRVDVEEKHIKQIVSLFKMQVGKKINLPNGVVAIRVHDGICFSKGSLSKFQSREFKEIDMFETEIGKIEITRKNQADFTKDGLYLDGDKVPFDAVWRKIQNGDKFTKFSGGTKTIAKFLTDKKIDASTRQKMVILATGDEVLAVPGIEISRQVKIMPETKKIVKIRLV